MKKYCTLAVLMLGMIGHMSAKKVKFAVDMSNEIVNVTGVHISGDFQVAAGDSADWCAECTPLTKEGSTNIYSVIVDIPAFKKYEYKFLNGDQFYEAEFVPEPSRVGYDFNDNRWLYVDSIANDTTFVGNIVFGGNAPAGKLLLRFLVDMQKQTVDAKGVHVAGSFQSWDTKNNILYHFDSAQVNVYEVITYVTSGTYQYRYYNGNTSGNAETVPGTCSANNSRSITLTADTVLPAVCFSSCTSCSAVGLKEYQRINGLKVYPNPTADLINLSFVTKSGNKKIIVTDVQGKIVRSYPAVNGDLFEFRKENLSGGTYFIHVQYSDNSFSNEKLIIE